MIRIRRWPLSLGRWAFVLASLLATACPAQAPSLRRPRGPATSPRCGNGVLEAGEACDLGTRANAVRPGGCTATCERAPAAGAFPEFRVVYLRPKTTQVYRLAPGGQGRLTDDFISASVGYAGQDRWQLELRLHCQGRACRPTTQIEAVFFPSMVRRRPLSGCDGSPTKPPPLQLCGGDGDCQQSAPYCVRRRGSAPGRGALPACGAKGHCPDGSACGAKGLCVTFGRCGRCRRGRSDCPSGRTCDAHGRCVASCLKALHYYYPRGAGFRLPALDWNLDPDLLSVDGFLRSSRLVQASAYIRGARDPAAFNQQSYYGFAYPAPAAPLAIMADRRRALLVAAINWPPLNVVPAFAAQRLELGYYSVGHPRSGINWLPLYRKMINWPMGLAGTVPTRGGPARRYRALISELALPRRAAPGLEPWQLAADRYRRWLDRRLKVRYPDWVHRAPVLVTAHLGGRPLAAIKRQVLDPIAARRDRLRWVLFWGKECSPKLRAWCWHPRPKEAPSFGAHPRLLGPLGPGTRPGGRAAPSFRDVIRSWLRPTPARPPTQRPMRVGFYAHPAPRYTDRIVYRLDGDRGYRYLRDYLAKNRAFGANTAYVDLLGGANLGAIATLMGLFEGVKVPGNRRPPLLPPGTVTEGAVDVFPSVGLLDGSLGRPFGIAQYDQGSVTPPANKSQGFCALAAAYPRAAPWHRCARPGADAPQAFPELAFYLLTGRVLTLGGNNSDYPVHLKNCRRCPHPRRWNSLGPRLAFGLGAHLSILTVRGSHHDFITSLRRAVAWWPTAKRPRPRFVHHQGLRIQGGLRAYRFTRGPGESLITVDDWQGRGGQLQFSGRRITFGPSPHGRGRICILQLSAQTLTRHCCQVHHGPEGGRVSCPPATVGPPGSLPKR